MNCFSDWMLIEMSGFAKMFSVCRSSHFAGILYVFQKGWAKEDEEKTT